MGKNCNTKIKYKHEFKGKMQCKLREFLMNCGLQCLQKTVVSKEIKVV